MRKNLLVSLALSLLFLVNVYGQGKAEGQLCADVPGKTSGLLRFRHEGETFEIAIRGQGASADCEPVALSLHWANGRNNGSNFSVTFLDENNKPIFARQITAFLSGVLSLSLSSYETQPTYGFAMSSVPTTITIQAVRPFAPPASLSYSITRVARAPRKLDQQEEREKAEATKTPAVEKSSSASPGQPLGGAEQGNEIASIRNTVRLIGTSRLPVVQIELKTSRPFPVRDLPLQLQIGKKVFTDELSGDYTGRKLTLSLTPEMFAEIRDGDELVVFFGKPDGTRSADQDVWNFGKLSKGRRQ